MTVPLGTASQCRLLPSQETWRGCWLNPRTADRRHWTTDLSRCNFAGARLDLTDLEGADLAGADLTGAFLRLTSHFRTNMSGARLRRSLGDQVLISQSNLKNADMTDAYLVGAELEHSTLVNADFAGSDLLDTQMSDSDPSSANFTKAENH